ncbi:MAG: methionine adenosyltransferase [Candidatus Nitrosocaldus sp.]|nr:methionine adenosyltransferase [Candidatus Nitrosocaldus sp.]MCS7141184.1 methionine adenosyltransferase [Candidatus Nitrosocaldus sp.]MDW8000210.1 methionine adenosyltransferase [Candidatus Nitrosocaldus sp.]
MMKQLFTSESVTEGHPDKVCDSIADAILDGYIAGDKYSRVAVEILATAGLIVVAGEVTSSAHVDIPRVVREVVQDIGYGSSDSGLDLDRCKLITSLHEQSPDIAMGVVRGNSIGAGDQGLMFGYACDETEELMPMPIMLANRLCMRLAELRKRGIIPWLRPDGKSQVTVEYEDGVVRGVKAIVLSAQHAPDVDIETVRRELMEKAILPVCNELIDSSTRFYINPTGRFVIGGPAGDTGLTGRKVIVDTYGGACKHGGGAFSGKDPTKVDRSASYMMRYIAKNVVASGLARRCELQVAYAIGVAEPIALYVNTFNTGRVSDEELGMYIMRNFDLTPAGIIESLDLRRPIYRKTAAYGHFGRSEPEFTWERLDRVDMFRGLAG